ncbi:uncharacterized protein LOC115450119 [Manduca sexta]|uniref:uncharacterized protein LOC115450119 n=1 Tax=Manduca sexta TaxID=7130 RepID=UPI00188EF31B|nr:uncharacterized protein LOC115450119 [Manduca sexta]
MSTETKLRVNAAQTQLLCTFFEENPEVIKGYKKTPECVDVVQTKWKKITQQLNTLGPSRDHRGWAKYLCDMKAKLKRKHIKWKQNSNGKGAVMCNADEFNEIKLRMLQVMRKYPTDTHKSHDSSLSDLEIENVKEPDISNDDIDPKKSPNVSNDSINERLASPPLGSEFVIEYDNDDFDAFGKHIAEQLRTMPHPVALETQEMLLSILRKQKLLNSICNTIDPLEKL